MKSALQIDRNRTLTGDELIAVFRDLVAQQRRITRKLLEMINEVERRKLYADLGFPSLFDWMVKDIGFSESAAYRRIGAARILRSVPLVAKKIESGQLNLTTLSKAQSTIKAEEKRTGKKLDDATKAVVLSQLEAKSSREAGVALAEIFPEVSTPRPESVRVCSDERVSVQLVFAKEQFEKLQRVREVLSHSHFDASISELIEVLSDEFLKRRDPMNRAASPKHVQASATPQGDTGAQVRKRIRRSHAVGAKKIARARKTDRASRAINASINSGAPLTKRKYIPLYVRRSVIKRANGQCEYRCKKTGKRCESRYQIQIDHRNPVAWGGGNDEANLRVLCRTHNLLMAEKLLGELNDPRIDGSSSRKIRVRLPTKISRPDFHHASGRTEMVSSSTNQRFQ